MAERAITRSISGGGSGIGAILGTGDRDFLVRNSGEQVKICSIGAGTVALYFSASWCPPCRLFTPKLIQTYQEQQQQQHLEVVLVSRDRDEDSFCAYFAKMPPTWLAVPFSDTDHITRLVSRFKVTSIPCLVLLGAETGEIHTKEGVRLIAEHGVAASPFTPERIGELKELEKAAKENQTVHSVLATPARDYLISNRAGEKVPISELEGKHVALCFTATPMEDEFTVKFVALYEKLRDVVGVRLEVVFVYFSCDESVFQQSFFVENNSRVPPWLAVPHGDPTCDRLVRYFDLRAVPTLVLLGPHGKTVCGNFADSVEEHGAEAWEAFPFDSDEKMEGLKRKAVGRAATQTLESLLVQGDLDYVVANGKDGAKVPVSDLVGKTVLLYFSAKWCPPCRAFLPTLVKEYGKMRQRTCSSDDDGFEMVFVSLDRDQSAYDDYFSGMPCLALPFDDARKEPLMRRFRVRSIPWLVAVGPSGQTLTADAVAHVVAHGADAFPFTAEVIGELERGMDQEARASWPKKVVRHHLHELELTRRDAAAGTYTCDGCEEVGSKWAYRCEQCDFDLHPKCAWEKEKEEEEEEEEEGTAGIEQRLPAAYVCEGGACTKA